jgi:hypothetical protein
MKTLTAREHFDEAVTEDVRDRGTEQGSASSRMQLQATAVRYLADRHAIELCFGDVTAITLPVASYEELAVLAPEDLSRLTLGFGGQALCLEERDLHISLAGMVAASKPIQNIAASLFLEAGNAHGGARQVAEPRLFVSGNPAAMRRFVNLHEHWEVQYWTKELGISKEDLERAVKMAGDQLDVVVHLRSAEA